MMVTTNNEQFWIRFREIFPDLPKNIKTMTLVLNADEIVVIKDCEFYPEVELGKHA